MSASWSFPELFIDGRWQRPADGRVAPSTNPATEQPVGDAPVGGVEDCERAIAAARAAFDHGPWATATPRERAAALTRIRDNLETRFDELVDLAVAEAGSTVAIARALQVGTALEHLEAYIEVAGRDRDAPLPIEANPRTGGLSTGVKVREPIGVVAAVTPFNFPFLLGVNKVGPALAAGNTVVLKPSPHTPLLSLVLAQAVADADLPPGVVNVITGEADVGTTLTSHPGVDHISFTGSDQVGAAVMAQAAPTLKKLLLELGGKSAAIVREDADLDLAVAAGGLQFTIHAGQGCALCTRILVHTGVYDDFLDRLTTRLARVTVGDPADPKVRMGPLISAAQRDRVERYVAGGREAGAELVFGGGRPAGQDRGYFVEPTVFAGVDNRSALAQEEVFGPVAAVIPFTTDDEAVAMANDSPYGLSGDVYSRDVAAAYAIARRMRTGGVLINGGSGRLSPHVPFGGYKRSGLGREYGQEGMDEYTQLKSIVFPLR